MQVLSERPQINFLGMRHFWVALSIFLNVVAFVLWFSKGDEKYGVDFRGGTELVVRFKEAAQVSSIREVFTKNGFEGAVIQAFSGTDKEFAIRLSQDEGSEAGKEKVRKVLQEVGGGGYELIKEDFVGPVIGAEIRRDALYAIILSIIAMLIYIGIRFEWEYGFGGIFAIFHDVIVTVGVCLLFEKEMSAGILAALLTIAGYSINDTIIVYDRIRENINKLGKKGNKKRGEHSELNLLEVMNLSINETLSRTILTSMTAFIVVTVLWLMGGGAVVDMSFALMVGILVGTYSSIFIACPIVLACQSFRKAK